jgi:hypothetical protein
LNFFFRRLAALALRQPADAVALEAAMTASSSIESTVDLASLGISATDSRTFHFATLFWLIQWRLASALRLS